MALLVTMPSHTSTPVIRVARVRSHDTQFAVGNMEDGFKEGTRVWRNQHNTPLSVRGVLCISMLTNVVLSCKKSAGGTMLLGPGTRRMRKLLTTCCDVANFEIVKFDGGNFGVKNYYYA